MIVFRQKEFSEYDAMRQLYVELDKLGCIKNHKVEVINQSALIPVLRGNNIVIEKFTQATRVFGKDRYRMYIKVGAKAKMPDDVRLPQTSYNKSLGTLNLGLNFGFDVNGQDKGKDENNQDKGNQGGGKGSNKSGGNITYTNIFSDTSSHPNNTFRQKEFGKNNKNNNNNNGGGGGKYFNVKFNPSVDFLNYQVHELLGDAIKYDKKDRSLVLEFDSIFNAIKALNILPFGIGYKIYLLNA